MRVAAQDQEQIYRDLWLPMQDGLGGALADFFRYDHISRNYFVRESDVYAVWRDRLDPLPTTELVAELGRLADDSALYCRLIDPRCEPSLEIRTRLERLNRWGGQTMYPFLLNVYRALRSGDIEAGGVAEIVAMIESFLVRRLFAGVPTNALNRLFIRLWQQLPPGSELVEATRLTLSQSSRRWPRDDEFRAAILRFPLYLNGRPGQRHLILESLEQSYGHKEKVDLAPLTIEHVMPQSLTASWANMLGGTANQVHGRYLHTLGNLTLTGYNAPLSNSPFEEKRKLLAESNVEMNRAIAAQPVWTEAEIVERANALTDRAIKIWTSPLTTATDDGVIEVPGPIPWPPLHDPIDGPSLDEVKFVLKRRPLGDGQLKALRALYGAGEGGLLVRRAGRCAQPDPARALRRARLAGVTGAPQRRLRPEQEERYWHADRLALRRR